MDTYTIRIEKMDTGDYFVKIQEYPGCMSEGKTELEALKNILKVKKEWMKAAKEDGSIKVFFREEDIFFG